MKTTKNLAFLFIATLLFGFAFTSCGDDDDDPEIESKSLELYYDGKKITDGETITITDATTDELYETVSMKAPFNVKNTSAGKLNVLIKREVISMAAGTSDTYCWSECWVKAPETDEYPISIASKETTSSAATYALYSPAYKTAGTTKIKYTFYVENKPEDKVSVIYIFNYAPEVSAVSLELYYNSKLVTDGETFKITEATTDPLYNTTTMKAPFNVKNISTEKLNVVIKREVISMATGASDTYCWAQCWNKAPEKDEYPVEILASETTLSSATYALYSPVTGTAGSSTIKYTFSVENKPENKISVIYTFDYDGK